MSFPSSPERLARRMNFLGGGLLAMALGLVLGGGLGIGPLTDTRPTPHVVRFDVGTTLVESDTAVLAAVREQLAADPTAIALITGHTGPDGDPAANRRLSMDRARVVADALAGQAAPDDTLAMTRLRLQGAGGTAPPAPRPGESPAALQERTKRATILILENRLTAPGETP